MATKLTSADASNLDRQIQHLYTCKPLPESEVKALCEKVINENELKRQKKS